MLSLNGTELCLRQLSLMSGLNEDTIRSRWRRHPDWSVDQLTAAKNSQFRTITVDGEKYLLAEWARKNKVDKNVVYYRWKCGERDPYKLLETREDGKKREQTMPFIPPDVLEHLRITRSARRGLENEWELACDLAGISRRWAPRLKEYMEERA